MIRSLATTSLILALIAPACGPETPGGTTPPSDATEKTSESDGGESTPAQEGGDAGDAGDASKSEGTEPAQPAAEDPSKKVCDAKVLGAPTALFAESMLIRLPHGMDPDSLVEETPFFIRAPSFDSVSCVEGLPGATVSFTAMGYFEDDPKKSVTDYRDETFEALGYPKGLKFSQEQTNGRNYEVAADVPPDAKNPEPAKAWFVLKSKYGRMYYVIYQVHPNAWNAMKKTLKLSTDKMFLLDVNG